MPKRGGRAKAYRSMLKRYGRKKGRQVYYARANKYGKRGKSMAAKERSTYSRGAKLKRRRRRGRKRRR